MDHEIRECDLNLEHLAGFDQIVAVAMYGEVDWTKDLGPIPQLATFWDRGIELQPSEVETVAVRVDELTQEVMSRLRAKLNSLFKDQVQHG